MTHEVKARDKKEAAKILSRVANELNLYITHFEGCKGNNVTTAQILEQDDEHFPFVVQVSGGWSDDIDRAKEMFA